MFNLFKKDPLIERIRRSHQADLKLSDISRLKQDWNQLRKDRIRIYGE